MQLGITTQMGGSYFGFNSNNLSFATPNNVHTALPKGGWVPAVAQYGNNVYAQRRLYDPVEEKIKFQIYASGNDAGARIHHELRRLSFILDRAKKAQKNLEVNYPLLYYAVSGVSTSPSNTLSTTVFTSLVYDGKIVLPEDYTQVIYLKKALDVELTVLRDGLWFPPAAYADLQMYSGIRTGLDFDSNNFIGNQTYTFDTRGFKRGTLMDFSDFANGIDVNIGPFPSVNNFYYMPQGYVIYHAGTRDHGIARPFADELGGTVKGSLDSSITQVTHDTAQYYARHNPLSSGWVTFMPPDIYRSSMVLKSPDLSYTGTFAGQYTHTHHVFGEFATSGTVSFVLQPMLQSESGPDQAFYGQETILSSMQYPEYVYLGVINTSSEQNNLLMNYRTRRISGSGALHVKEFHVFSNENTKITKLLPPVTFSGIINPHSLSVKPSGWLSLFHNYAGLTGQPNTSSLYNSRPSTAANGPTVRLVTENVDNFLSNLDDPYDFYVPNFAYNVNAIGDYGSLLETKTFFGGTQYGTADNGTIDINVTLLWAQGSNRNSWRFTYPSGLFDPYVYVYLTPYYPVIPRL